MLRTFTCIILRVIYTIQVKEDQEFDTTVQGPWMRKWEITHINTHVKKHQETEKAKS